MQRSGAEATRGAGRPAGAGRVATGTMTARMSGVVRRCWQRHPRLRVIKLVGLDQHLGLESQDGPAPHRQGRDRATRPDAAERHPAPLTTTHPAQHPSNATLGHAEWSALVVEDSKVALIERQHIDPSVRQRPVAAFPHQRRCLIPMSGRARVRILWCVRITDDYHRVPSIVDGALTRAGRFRRVGSRWAVRVTRTVR